MDLCDFTQDNTGGRASDWATLPEAAKCPAILQANIDMIQLCGLECEVRAEPMPTSRSDLLLTLHTYTRNG
ncbi:uncharacterized protein CLUP02_15351 [Colletotrichum lupini]|uniref:Uncharacterized protein n=1 Tax=Colletotrichum lupini TaxID=145971 RepID=A0A9Q8T6D0_9PEZI|nr:uncharacterized protein CLUP02_15351 [Colletotrichum lupini]UQC89820.1 hypothetical protein CLUP02_15351 [Colletotrichum lupini]